jgi:hypothetical protein
MRKPSIHLNGTSLDALSEDYTEARCAVSRAITALEKNPPNARDYYVQGKHAYSEAVQEHYDRIRRLESVYSDLLEICEYLAEAVD